MDESRWPPFIRSFIDQVGQNADSLVLDVQYRSPFWTVTATCPCCKLSRIWTIATEPPLPLPEEIPVPEFLRDVLA